MIHPVRLDAEHRYWVPVPHGENEVPGYTAIARDLGIAKDNPFWTEEGRAEGTALHRWIHYLCQGKTPKSEPDYRIAGRVAGIKKFLSESDFRFAGGEEPRYVPAHRFSCTPDIYGYMNGFSVNIDVKRGAEKKSDILQLAAQKIALCANGFQVQKSFNLYLNDGDFRLKERMVRPHEARWNMFVASYHAKMDYI